MEQEELNQTEVENIEGASLSKNPAAAIIISIVFCLVMFAALWKGYNRGTDNYTWFHDAKGVLMVQALFYLYILITFGLSIFLGWFLISDLKNKKMKGLFIFPFIATLYIFTYFFIFEKGYFMGEGFGMGAVATFVSEIIAIPFYLIFLMNFITKRESVDTADKMLFGAFVLHPFLFAIVGNLLYGVVSLFIN